MSENSLPTAEDPRMLFGKKLREFRLAKSLSQEKFALLAGVDRTYVSDCENGGRNTSLELIYKFAKALEIEPYELLKK